MSFYQILFSILFLGACKEAFQAFFDKKKVIFAMAATVALLIFNDVLYTSHEIELDRLYYSIPMKLIDLFNFLIMAYVLIILSPGNNILYVKVKKIHKEQNEEAIFWGLITLFWILSLIWDHLANLYSVKTGLIRIVPYLFLVPFMTAFFLNLINIKKKKDTGRKESAVLKWNRILILVILGAYILIFKPLIYPY